MDEICEIYFYFDDNKLFKKTYIYNITTLKRERGFEMAYEACWFLVAKQLYNYLCPFVRMSAFGRNTIFVALIEMEFFLCALSSPTWASIVSWSEAEIQKYRNMIFSIPIWDKSLFVHVLIPLLYEHLLSVSQATKGRNVKIWKRDFLGPL